VKEYRSKVDWWMYIALALPLVGGGAALLAGITSNRTSTIVAGTGALVFVALVLSLLVLPMRYTLDDNDLRIRAGLLIRIVIPLSRIISVEPTRNPLSSPALSLDRLAIAYKKGGGGYTVVRISPMDRSAFLADIIAVSPRHRMDGDRVIVK
jgi:membrane protein YdbS with pleckstrin-like domain